MPQTDLSKGFAGIGLLALVACGGAPPDQTGSTSKVASSPGLVQKVVTVQGAPITVTWREADPVQAEARGEIPPEQPVEAAATAIRTATGCRVPTEGVDFGKSIFFEADGQVRFTLAMDCSPAAAPPAGAGTTAQNQSDILLAAAVEEAVRAVVGAPTVRTPSLAQPAVVETPTPAPQPAALVQPDSTRPSATPAQLYEGSPYAAFTSAQIQSYCSQDWTTRVAENGRTEYNPCKERSAFR